LFALNRKQAPVFPAWAAAGRASQWLLGVSFVAYAALALAYIAVIW
jgi:hypothetical protein